MASPRLALRWLHGQAVRLANGLDPDQGTPWISPYVLRPVPSPVPDAPTALRARAADDQRQDEALQRLAAGIEFEFITGDGTCWYGLTARPLCVPVPEAAESAAEAGAPIAA
ncbi:hypothetical protein [Streptomyces sp. NPDC018000]|uniref:hypothetical protein n=1 Tax=Streptomyces sp. NPDC018000 TaxID=3365028 RepID=UPI003789B518